MHIKLLFAGIASLMGLAFAQSSNDPDLQLKGGRFKPLTYAGMTAEQKTMTDHVLAGKRGSMDGPYNVLLRSPVMGDLAQQFGAEMRFNSSLPKKLNELAILMTARFWNSQFEWYAHHKFALEAGLSPQLIASLSAGERPSSMDPDEEAVFTFCNELLQTRQVSDATFNRAKEKFGERGIVDLIGVLGYYHIVSMALNIDEYPLPEGVHPELKPIRRAE
jgi:4-carboxymuconolactone decarboxylase